MPIHAYAEHLLNIRTLTIQATLPTDSDASTSLFCDGDIFKISHQGEAVKITLPVAVPASESTKLNLPQAPTRNLSFRIRLGDNSPPQDSHANETVIPWTASSLTQQVELQCKACHAVISPRGTIQTWKDLPSEGWAEMMEFWHCHKPNEPHDHEHQTDKKGYSANSTLSTTSSVGLVNATSFILAADDCKNIQSTSSPNDPFASSRLSCSSCGATVGILDDSTNSYKLYKLALSISLNSDHRQSFAATKWLSCHLLNSMDNQGLRKFVVTSGSRSHQPLLIWLFAPDLNISSSAVHNDTPLRVCKILWKLAPEQSQDGRLNEQSMSEGEIEVPDFELDALRQSLEKSVVLLPETARTFQDWNVALLERFTMSEAVLQ